MANENVLPKRRAARAGQVTSNNKFNSHTSANSYIKPKMKQPPCYYPSPTVNLERGGQLVNFILCQLGGATFWDGELYGWMLSRWEEGGKVRDSLFDLY